MTYIWVMPYIYGHEALTADSLARSARRNAKEIQLKEQA